MFSNFLIGLREGLEASLVVGILVAYLVRTGNRRHLSAIWAGAGAAVALSLGAGAVLTFTSNALSFKAQETFGGVMSLVAVGFVTGMIFWMKRESRNLRGDLQGRLEGALTGGGIGLALVALMSVGREGLETAVFVWSAVQAAGSGASPVIGAFLGLVSAVVIGWLIYRRSVSLNLAVFFKVTGAALVVVVAGILAYGIHDLQEAGVLPGLHALAFDISRQIPPSSWYGTLLKGVFNISPNFTWLELVAYVGYLVPVMVLFFRPPRTDAITSARASAATNNRIVAR
jgi:high-affinity iron transporter